jgi:hypothetical protein
LNVFWVRWRCKIFNNEIFFHSMFPLTNIELNQTDFSNVSSIQLIA